MAHFAVITDSTADIPPALSQKLGIQVVPLSVSFGSETFADGELSQADFFARMATAPTLPTTSQPPVGAFVEAYERALETAPSVLSIHISNRLSGTVESATQAAEQFGERVHVFDSLNLSMALGYQAIEAARAAAEGLTREAAVQRVERVRDRIRMLVGLDSLENLAKGGRIGAVSAFLGSLLDLKVTLTVDETGAFKPVKRVRGEKAAIKHTMDWVADTMGSAKEAAFAVGHAFSAERAERMRHMVEERFGITELVEYEAGSVICAHTGTGWGVVVLPAE